MSQENLPMELKNNQLAVNKRINRRKIEEVKRVGKIVLNGAIGLTAVGAASIGSIVGMPLATVAGLGIGVASWTNGLINIAQRKISKDSMFVLMKAKNGELKIFQSITDIKSFQKMKGFNTIEKGAMMGLELLGQLQVLKQKYADQCIQTEPSQIGGNNVYPQVYSTITHGINTKTVEALEQLGYLQIERKELHKKSNLFLEKMLFGQYKEAVQGVVSSFSKDESKKHEVQMYDMAFKITDKPLDFENIYKTYMDLKDTTDKNPIRKPIKRLGIIIETLRNRNIDIMTNEIGETIIDYKAPESFANRMKRERTNSSEEYRKASYIGDTIEQGPVQISEQSREETEQKGIQDSELQL